MCMEDKGGRAISPSSSPSPKDPDPGVCATPSLRGLEGDAPGLLSLSLSPSPRFLFEGMFHLPPGRILRRIGVPRFTMAMLRTLRKAVSEMKR
jgi:hypothetical protein